MLREEQCGRRHAPFAASSEESLLLTPACFVIAVGHTVTGVCITASGKPAEGAIAEGSATSRLPTDGQPRKRENAERDTADSQTSHGHTSHCYDTERDPANRNHAAGTAAACDDSYGRGPGSEERNASDAGRRFVGTEFVNRHRATHDHWQDYDENRHEKNIQNPKAARDRASVGGTLGQTDAYGPHPTRTTGGTPTS